MLVLAALVTSCKKETEVFYSTSYPIVGVDALVTLSTPMPTALPREGEEPEPEPEDPLITEIREDILSKAPMAAGGIYAIEFTRHNGGVLNVRLTPDTQTIEGVFVKIPGKGTLTFYFSKQEHTYLINSYDNNGTRKVVLAADLTEHYKALYPERKDIQKVLRREYTSVVTK